MSVYAVIENGIVTNVIKASNWPGGVDITSMSPRPSIGWTYNGEDFAPPAPSTEELDGPGPFLSNYAFDMRFTLPERIAIKRLALETDSNGISTDTALAVQTNLERAAKARYVNPNRQATRDGVMQFVTLGVLSEARALEILDAPIQKHEEWTP